MPTGLRQLLDLSFAQLWRFLAIALPALAALLVPMPAVDLAYQLRAGAQILVGEGIPATDTWTFTVAGTPWLDQQWGAQVILAAVYQAASWTGLALLRAALVAATLALLLATIRSAWSKASVRAGGSATASSARTATLITLGGFIVAAPALALRPQLFAIVLFAATLLILVERAEHPRRLWLIPVFAAAWANLHGSFPLIVVLVFLAWVDEVSLLREPPAPGHPVRTLPQRLLGSTGLALIGAFAALATLITPFGIDAWRYVVSLARNPTISSQVSEWRPPSPLDPAGAVFYVSLLLVVVLVAFRLRTDLGRPAPRSIAAFASILTFGVLGVLTGRGIAWWALAAPVAIVQLQPGLKLADVRLPGRLRLRARTAREASASEGRRSPLNGILVAVLALAGVALLPLWRPTGPAGVPVLTLSHAPQAIAAELDHMTATGYRNVWAPQTWASFLEFAAPGSCYAVDSRIELFPQDLWDDASQVSSGSAEWLSVFTKRDAEVIVISAEQAQLLEPVLEASTFWSPAHRDGEGSIWIRELNAVGRQLGCPT